MIVTKENFQQVREQGIGNGFTVINPADGYQKNNRVWFGTCSVCGEMVTNSALTGNGWEHSVKGAKLTPDGEIIYTYSKSVNYCPKVGE